MFMNLGNNSVYLDVKEESGNEGLKSKKKRKQVYTIREVIKQQYRNRVDSKIPYPSNDKRYISSYQRAVMTVLNNMEKKEREEAENILRQWNENGPPSNIQIRYFICLIISALWNNGGSCRRAKTKLPKDIKKKVEEWKFSTGAAVLCLVAYSDGLNVQTFQ